MRREGTRAAGVLGLLLLAGCAAVGYPSPRPPPAPADAAPGPPGRTYEVLGRTYRTLATAEGYREAGLASWYGEEFQGRPTASGETYDMHGLTAAHRSLPLPTCVEVTRVADGRSVVVRVNDRGPFVDVERRVIDLSYGAARALGIVGVGVAEVEVEAVSPDACPETPPDPR